MNGNSMEKPRREEVAMVPKAGWGDKSAAWGDDDGDGVGFEEGQCGVGSCAPGALQIFSGIKTFTAIFGLVTLMVTGLRSYMAYNAIWLRRLYDLTVDQANMLVSCLDIGFLVMVLFLSAVAKRWHAPRTLSIATAVVGVGAFLVFMPHAIHKSELTPIPNVTEETQFTMDKLIFMAPTCTVNPKMSAAMTKLFTAKPGSGPDCDVEEGGQASASSSGDKSKPPAGGNTPTVVDSSGSKDGGPEYNKPGEKDNDDGAAPEGGSTPAPGASVAPGDVKPAEAEQPEVPMEEIEVPDFQLLAKHPLFDTIADLAQKMHGADLRKLTTLNREDQIKALMTMMPAESSDELTKLKGLLGDDAKDIFYKVKVPKRAAAAPNRRKRQASQQGDAAVANGNGTGDNSVSIETTPAPSAKDKMLAALKKDMMWTGQLARMVRTAFADVFNNPCTQKKIKKMAASMCPFNTAPFFEDTEGSATAFVALVSIGMVLVGLARAAYPAFMAIYVDNRTWENGTGIFIGIIFMFAALGPLLGFLLFGLTSSTYITLEDTGLMGHLNPRWLAAWWVGPLAVCVACLVFAFPLFFFPNVRDRSAKAAHAKGFSKITKGFFQGIMRLLGNPIFLLVTLGNAVTVMAAEGMLSQFPQFVEKHFSFSMEAGFGFGLLMGLIIVVGAVLGGVITSASGLSPFGCLKLVAGCTLVMVILQAASLGLGCDQPVVNKGDMMVNDTMTNQPLACSQTCVCMDFLYMPVCGSDGMSYFSPCHAGCGHPHDKEWHHCKCMADDTQTATPGLCTQDCQGGMFIGYGIVMGLACLLLAVKAVPAFLVTLRCVERQDSHLAIGVNAFLATLIGTVPGPMIFKAIFNNSCLMERIPCGPVDTCAMYDVSALGMRFNGLGAGLRALAALFYVVAMVLGFRSESVFSRAVHEQDRRK